MNPFVRLLANLVKGTTLSVLGGILIFSLSVFREACLTRDMFRNRPGLLELPVVTYRHPTTGREAVVISISHIAIPSYYDSLGVLIAQLSRHHVLCEGIRKSQSLRSTKSRTDEADIRRDIDTIFDSQEHLAELLGLESQDEGLPERPSWENIDLTEVQLSRTFTENGIRFAEGAREASSVLDEPWAVPIVRWGANAAFLNVAASRVSAWLLGISVGGEGSYRVIVGTRDLSLAAGIRSRLSDDLVIVWGLEHYPAIRRTLEQAGYRETDRRWFVAYRDRGYSLVASLTEAWSEFEIVSGSVVSAPKPQSGGRQSGIR